MRAVRVSFSLFLWKCDGEKGGYVTVGKRNKFSGIDGL